MKDYVMDLLQPVSHSLRAWDLKSADAMAKALLHKGETLLSVKPLDMWTEHEKLKMQGQVPDAKK